MKQFFTTLMFLGLLGPSFSQRNRIDAGFHAGPNFTGTRGNYHRPQDDGHIGFFGGLSVQYNFPKLFSLYSGLRYDQKKVDTDVAVLFDDYYDYGYHRVTTMRYLNLPLLLRISFGKNDLFFIHTGGYISYLVDQRSTYTHTDGYPAPIPSSVYPVKPGTANYIWDAGASFGAGLQIPLASKLKLCMELRNDLGLRDLSEPAADLITKETLRLNTCQLLVGVTYSFAARSN